jgi:hypothetical protein
MVINEEEEEEIGHQPFSILSSCYFQSNPVTVLGLTHVLSWVVAPLLSFSMTPLPPSLRVNGFGGVDFSFFRQF